MENKVIVESWVEDFMRAHALIKREEIYGWLIGHEDKDGNVIVMSAIPCQRYITQNVIAARPDTQELQDIARALPTGLGFIGVYHSHPEDVFHSRADDEFITTLSRFYPKLVSAVTNRVDLKWYRYAGNSKFAEFDVTRVNELDNKPAVLNAEATVEYVLGVDPSIPAMPQISNALVDALEKTWEDGTVSFYYIDKNKKQKRFKENQKIKEVKKGVRLAAASKYFEGNDVLVRVTLSLSPPQSPGATVVMQGKGDNPVRLRGLLLVKPREETIDGLLDKLKKEFIDDLLIKTGRGYFTARGGSIPRLQLPDTVFLSYIGTPLKTRLHLSPPISGADGQLPDTFPSSHRFTSIENEFLESMKQRTRTLRKCKKEDLAAVILDELKAIYKQRGDVESAESIDRFKVYIS